MGHRIGFVSTRFAGTDGVSLESAKWAQLLWDHEHVSHWYAGKLDREPGLTRAELARRLGISRPRVTQILSIPQRGNLENIRWSSDDHDLDSATSSIGEP